VSAFQCITLPQFTHFFAKNHYLCTLGTKIPYMSATVKLNSKIIGEGDPIIILHGLFGMLDNWATIAKKLADSGYMCIMLDQRDHGRSPHTAAFDYDLLADDLAAFMDDNWIFRAHLMGHSMGGKTAINFAAKHPDKLEKLIIVDMGIKTYQDGHSDIFRALMDIDVTNVENRSEVEKILSKNINEESTVQFLMKSLSRSKKGGYEWKMNLPLLWSSYANILEQITISEPIDVPTCFIRGERSMYVLNSDIAELKSHFLNFELKTIKNAGHWIHAERPNELLSEILHFLK